MGRYRPPTKPSAPFITAEGDRSENAEYQYRGKQLAEIDRQRFKQPILKLFQATFPFLLIMLLWLLLITYIPFLTTWWQG